MKTQVIVLMGVSGSGKTTVGEAIASELSWDFFDGDDYHPPPNLAKMSAGQPLTDADRASWLKVLHDLIARREPKDPGMVLACSALKQKYRDQLLADVPKTSLVYLRGDKDLIERRMRARRAHYMKAGMLESQLTDLEEPLNALTIDIDQPVDAIVHTIIDHFDLQPIE